MPDKDFQAEAVDRLARIETKLDNVCAGMAANNAAHEKIHEKVNKNTSDISALKAKAGMWGAITGVVSGALISLGLRGIQ